MDHSVFNNNVSITDVIFRLMVLEDGQFRRIRKDWGGVCRGLFKGTFSEFTWKDWEDPL